MRHRQAPPWSINGSSYPALPDEPSRWDKFLVAENLEGKDLRNNPKVRDFIVKYSRTYFIPTKVLKWYGMDFDEI
jgi:hypothetical protein